MRILRPVAFHPRVQGIRRCHAIGVPPRYRHPVVAIAPVNFLQDLGSGHARLLLDSPELGGRPMQQPPIDISEIDARVKDHADELLRLWWAEQGGATKDRDLQIVSSSIPFPRDRALRTVDLCCGPGDLGRAIRQHYPNAQIDFVDRDPLLLSICRGFNGRAGMPGTYRQLDLNDESWCQGMRARHYDVIATANAVHWLSPARAKAVFGDIHRLLEVGGCRRKRPSLGPG